MTHSANRETSRLDRIEGELVRLQAINKHLRRSLLAVVIACGLIVTAGAQLSGPTNTVTARKFEVLDKRGERRILIGMQDDVPNPVVRMFASTGEPVFELECRAMAAGAGVEEPIELKLLNLKGQSRCRMLATSGSGSIAVNGEEDGNPWVGLMAGKEANLFL